MHKLYEIYFSPTGGTGRVSRILAEELSAALGIPEVTVDLLETLRDGGTLPEFTEEDICLISVPSFAGRVPLPAAEYLTSLKGCGARAILNVVFGNRAIDDTLLELKDILEDAGFVCTAAMETVAEHSIFRQFGAGRPDEKDSAELREFAGKAAELAAEHSAKGSLAVPGNYPYRERKPVSMVPEGSGDCTECGICAAECPVHAIPADSPKEVDRQVCFGCMRCVSVCPAGCRDIPAQLREKMLPHMSQVCSGRKENRIYLDRIKQAAEGKQEE